MSFFNLSTKISHHVISGWGGNLCSHLEDVGVRCSGPDMTKTCESSCGDGYFSSNGKCLECPLDCKTCTALDKCLSCNEMRFLEGIKLNFICVPEGQMWL